MFESIACEKNKIEEEIHKLNSIQGAEIVLYGAGYCGHETLTLMRRRGINVKAVCDDGRSGQELDGKRISSISEIKPKENLRIYVTAGFNVKMKEKLAELGLLPYCQNIDFGRYDEEKENYEYFGKHIDEIDRVYQLLSDDRSKEIYKKLVQYRICRDIRILDGCKDDSPQYFPDTPDLRRYIDGDKHIFLDLGAYDGDSIMSFINYTGGYERIIAVEASKINYEKLIQNCKNLLNIRCINIGISDKHQLLPFAISDAKNSFVSENGKSFLETDSIDNILNGEKVTFIKMDIEGSEYDALKGAKETIIHNKPILAVSMYHLVDDLWRLLLQIEKTIPDLYEYYIRHYSPTVIETVLYAIPKYAI